jgi:ubiquinone/menaquinone biosynthesis C-methylase UbiE
MHTSLMLALVLSLLPAPAGRAQTPTSPRNTWAAAYAKGSAESFATTFEEPSRPLFRYRQAIAGLMQIEPGMTVAEVGAGSGYLSKVLLEKVGPAGQVIANELEPNMVDFMNQRMAKEGVKNFVAVRGTPVSTGFQPASIDALAVVYAFSFFDHPAEMLTSIGASLKPNGLLLIVDAPREGLEAAAPGMDADEVVALAAAAGFGRVAESGIVPGMYALSFRKKQR